jgi:hypothetical protein
MKDSIVAAIFLGVILAIVLGGIAGFAIATEQVHKQAIANGAGHQVIVDGRVEFAWGAP